MKSMSTRRSTSRSSARVPSIQKVHGVGRHELRPRLHLVQHLRLQLGVDVAQEEEVGFSQRRRQHGVEVAEDVEVRLQGVGLVQIEAVATLPAEGGAGGPRDPREIDASLAEEVEVGLGEILPHHADDRDRTEEGGGGGKEGGGAARDLLPLSEGGLQAVEGDGTDGENGHGPDLARGTGGFNVAVRTKTLDSLMPSAYLCSLYAE
jgi:hypothetical protein